MIPAFSRDNQDTESNGSGAWVDSNVWAGLRLDATDDARGMHFQVAGVRGACGLAGWRVSESAIQKQPQILRLTTPRLKSSPGAPFAQDDRLFHDFVGCFATNSAPDEWERVATFRRSPAGREGVFMPHSQGFTRGYFRSLPPRGRGLRLGTIGRPRGIRPGGKAVIRGLFVYSSDVRLAPQETRTYFVTAVAAQRRSLFQVTATAELLQRTVLDYRSQGRFLLHAFVIMPDHFHALITPAPDVSLEKAMQFIKGGFSFRLKSKMDVWERSFNESQIMSEEKFINCVRYVEENPVRRRLASTPEEYLFSSAARGPFDPMPGHLQRGKK